MKLKHLFISVFLLFFIRIFAQTNLVPNPSFENFTICPNSFGFESYVLDWKSARSTPDYFNSCATNSSVSTPKNLYGFQTPYNGNGYIGMLTYRSDNASLTEAACVQLNQALVKGQKYFVSFRVSLTLENFTESKTAHNKIGVKFSTTGYSSLTPAPLSNFAHVYTDSIIKDTLKWTLVKGAFISDSNYTHLTLGNFFQKQYIDSIVFGSNFGGYYYFDDVCVSLDSNTCYSSISIEELGFSNSFLIFPNPANETIYIKNSLHNSKFRFRIFNVTGDIILQGEDIDGKQSELNIEYLTKGIYIIEVMNFQKTIRYKFLKS